MRSTGTGAALAAGLGVSKAAIVLEPEDLRRLIAERAPDLEVEGEMHGDAALSEVVRKAGVKAE